MHTYTCVPTYICVCTYTRYVCISIFDGIIHEVMMLSPRAMPSSGKTCSARLRKPPLQEVSMAMWAVALALGCLGEPEGKSLLLKTPWTGSLRGIGGPDLDAACLKYLKVFVSCQGRGAVSSPIQCKAYKSQ